MAKFNGGIFSKIKGKLAGVVFQQYEGMQVGKEYQPNVKNPGTAPQVENRAKFKLASQIVAVFQDVMLIAAANVSPYVRLVRGALVRSIRAAADYAQNEASITTSVLENAVNSLHFNTPVAKPTIAGSGISSATISATAGDTVRYTCVAVDDEGAIIGSVTNTFTATTTPEPVHAPLISGTASYYRIAAVAMRTTTDNGNAQFGNLLDISVINVTYAVRSGDMDTSNMAYIEVSA